MAEGRRLRQNRAAQGQKLLGLCGAVLFEQASQQRMFQQVTLGTAATDAGVIPHDTGQVMAGLGPILGGDMAAGLGYVGHQICGGASWVIDDLL